MQDCRQKPFHCPICPRKGIQNKKNSSSKHHNSKSGYRWSASYFCHVNVVMCYLEKRQIHKSYVTTANDRNLLIYLHKRNFASHCVILLQCLNLYRLKSQITQLQHDVSTKEAQLRFVTIVIFCQTLLAQFIVASMQQIWNWDRTFQLLVLILIRAYGQN